MNILQQIKPKKTVNNLEVVTKAPVVDISVSGQLTETSEILKKVSDVPKPPKPIPKNVINLDTLEVSEITNNFTILEFYPMCNLYIKHNSNLVKLDKKYLNHFSTELEQIHRVNSLSSIHNLLNYLKKCNYNIASFKLDVSIQGDMEISSHILEGTLYHKDSTVFIPEAYDNIIDFILNNIDLDIKYIQLLDIEQSIRDIKPTKKLELLQPNLKHCIYCEFNSTCNKI